MIIFHRSSSESPIRRQIRLLKDQCQSTPSASHLQKYQRLLREYQNTPLHESVLYHYALCLKKSRQYRLGLTSFYTLIQKYPTGSKVPQSLLHIAYIHLEEKRKQKGKATLSRLVQLYPQTEAAKTAKTILNSTRE